MQVLLLDFKELCSPKGSALGFPFNGKRKEKRPWYQKTAR
jgi:hypothetical protein